MLLIRLIVEASGDQRADSYFRQGLNLAKGETLPYVS